MTAATLAEAAALALREAQPAAKIRLTRETAAAWRDGRIAAPGRATPPDRPARPGQPELLPPNRMKRRGYGGAAGRAALLHALAHIELNAIDLAWDIIARFAGKEDLPRAFHDDWVRVAEDEADHFEALERLLTDLGVAYGDLPAHDGLWEAAMKTAHDLAARLAIVPMTLEARGCDTTPTTIGRLRRAGETTAIPALEIIYHDEIRHVASGMRWFRHVCAQRGEDAPSLYHHLIRTIHGSPLKPPFNHEARAKAGMGREFYEPVGVDGWNSDRGPISA